MNMFNSWSFKAALYLMTVAVLLLPLRGLAFDSSVVDARMGDTPCHTRAAEMYPAPDTLGDRACSCCDDPGLQHCFVLMATFDEVIIPLKRITYLQLQALYELIKFIPNESPFRPPRVS